MQPFKFTSLPQTIVFGAGRRTEARSWMEKLGCLRALVLSTPQQAGDAVALARALDGLGVGTFSDARMHSPIEITERAVAVAGDAHADCLVAIGGGSTTGLGKAIALRTGLKQIVIPTTYAGSEVTPILGQTEHGRKTTVRDPRLLPDVVIYDPELSVGLPVAMSVVSGLNAMAHAVEALYAADRNPISTLMAIDGLRAMRTALPALVTTPTDLDQRARALYGAWLCGAVLGTVGMALHHKICHTLGGSFDLPHAETHAVMLPHTASYNAAAVPDLLAPLSDLFGAPGGEGLFDFAATMGAPKSLRAIGMQEADLERAVELATANPYPNPRPIERDAVRAMLTRAFAGERPA